MNHAPTPSPSAGEISRLTEHLFRHESGKLVSVLTGLFGLDRLDLAEDVVQEALVRALQTWPYYGIPKNPAAWITQTAKNLALDLVRRENLFRQKVPKITVAFESAGAEIPADTSPLFEEEIRDDRLRLMFACCHPQVPAEAQSALALKTLCGFSVGEIARAFLTTEAAIAKRLVRARHKIRELKIPFEIPAGKECSRRLEGVLETLYLLFNEGYKASSGDHLVRAELCQEAIRLTTLLSQHPVGNAPRVHALLALMCLNAARLPARVDADGNLLRLAEQDRSHWNTELIARGLSHLDQSATGATFTEFHLQAAIAACHCTAPNYESTDWPRILSLYDRWIELNPSPIVALNRAVAVAHVNGPAAAILILESIPDRKSIESYYLYHAVLGEFEFQLGKSSEAAAHLRQALRLADLKSEQDFLARKLRECDLAQGMERTR
ncbi:MAG: sigma-70 family RNA polymerase sigma factor [Verrucomicrobiota bacterium]